MDQGVDYNTDKEYLKKWLEERLVKQSYMNDTKTMLTKTAKPKVKNFPANIKFIERASSADAKKDHNLGSLLMNKKKDGKANLKFEKKDPNKDKVAIKT